MGGLRCVSVHWKLNAFPDLFCSVSIEKLCFLVLNAKITPTHINIYVHNETQAMFMHRKVAIQLNNYVVVVFAAVVVVDDDDDDDVGGEYCYIFIHHHSW
jgi:hypothetical protein